MRTCRPASVRADRTNRLPATIRCPRLQRRRCFPILSSNDSGHRRYEKTDVISVAAVDCILEMKGNRKCRITEWIAATFIN